MDSMNQSIMNLTINNTNSTDAGTVSIPLFDGTIDQWFGWKQDIEDYLKLGKNSAHIEAEKTDEKDVKVKLQILSCLCPKSMRPTYRAHKSAHALWQSLKTRFDAMATRRFKDLMDELLNLKLEGDDIDSYINKYLNITEQLKTSGHELKLDEQKYHLFKGLDGRARQAETASDPESVTLFEAIGKVQPLYNKTTKINSYRQGHTYRSNWPRSRSKERYRANSPNGRQRHWQRNRSPRRYSSRRYSPRRYSPKRYSPRRYSPDSTERERNSEHRDARDDSRHSASSSESRRSEHESRRGGERPLSERSPTPKPKYSEYKALRTPRPHYSMLKSKVCTSDKEQSLGQIIWDGGSNNACFKTKSVFENLRPCSTTAVGMGGPLQITAKGDAKIAFKDFDLTIKNADYAPNAPDNLITPRTLTHIFWKFEEYEDHIVGHFRDGYSATVAKLDPESGLMHCLLKGDERPKRSVHYKLDRVYQVESYLDFHRRKGHPNREVTMQLAERDRVTLIDKHRECNGCVMAKMTERVPKERDFVSVRAGELVHMDLCGHFDPGLSHDQFKYALNIVDDYSGKVFFYSLKEKGEADACIRKCIAFIERMCDNRPVKYIHSDNGGEFSSKSLKEYLEEIGLPHLHTVAGAHFHNAKVERFHRTLQDKAKALMSDLDLKFGTAPGGAHLFPLLVEAFKYIVYQHNDTPSKANQRRQSPNQLFPQYVQPMPNYKFGDLAGVLNRKQSPKFSYSAQPMMVVGYANDKKGYRLYDPKNARAPIQISERIKICNDPDTIEMFMRGLSVQNRIQHPPTREESPNGRQYAKSKESEARKNERKMLALMKIPDESFVPQTFEQAIGCEQSDGWRQGMQSENDNMIEHQVMTPIKRTPDMKVLPLKWNFKKKGEQFKCRIVVGGHLQVQGVDYDVTFAPTLSLQNLRLLVAIATQLNYHIHSIDINGAFLNGDIDRDVYVKPGKGMIYSDLPADFVLKLEKGMYGLHQAGWQWRRKLDEAITSMGFRRSLLDGTIYFKKMPDGLTIYLAVYVDDILMIGPNESDLQKIKEEIGKHFTYKDGGKLSKFVGIDFLPMSGGIRLNQASSIVQLAKRHGCDQKFPHYSLPFSSGTILNPSENEDDYLGEDLAQEYRSMVPAMLYVARATRFDVCFPISQLARHYQDPRVEHFELAKRLLKYLFQTKDYSLMFEATPPSRLVGYSDSDHANRHDLYSYTGVVLLVNNSLIYWRTSLQTARAQSIDEAEMMAGNEGARQLMYCRHLTAELGLLENIVPELKVDNAGVFRSASRGLGERTKHLALQQLYVHALNEQKLMVVSTVKSQKNAADVLTKCSNSNQLSEAFRIARVGNFGGK